MIPISADQVMTYKDPKTGIVYKFKPLLGDAEYHYYAALDALSSKADHTPYLDKAEKAIEKDEPHKKWDKGEKEKAIRQEAMRLAAKDHVRSPADLKAEMQALNNLIDAVLVGWEIPAGAAFPEFRVPASGFFKQRDKQDFLKVIIDLNEDLTEAEEKN